MIHSGVLLRLLLLMISALHTILNERDNRFIQVHGTLNENFTIFVRFQYLINFLVALEFQQFCYDNVLINTVIIIENSHRLMRKLWLIHSDSNCVTEKVKLQ